jgi:hypothetical protein
MRIQKLANHYNCRTFYGRIPDASGTLMQVKERAIETGDWTQYRALRRAVLEAEDWLAQSREQGRGAGEVAS